MWKNIEGYEGWYQVSDKGEVRSLDRTVIYKDGRRRVFKGVVLRPVNSRGYWKVNLQKNKKMNTKDIHALVAAAFIPKPSYAQCVNHKDGNKRNNNVSNLEWVTYARNNQHARETGLNKSRGEVLVKYNIEHTQIKVAMYQNDELIAIKDCSREMAEFTKKLCKLDTNVETIARSIRTVCKQRELPKSNIPKGRSRKSAYGYTFKYFRDYSKACID